MPFNINEFHSRLSKKQLAHPAYFRVLFSGGIINGGDARLLALLCNQAQLPGRAFATTEYTTHGPIRKIPYQNVYDDLVFSIFCRDDMGVKETFQEWQNFICDNNTSNEFSYFEDYVSDVIIEQFRADGKSKYAVKLIDAYPVMVAPLQLDWATQNGFHNLQVTMAYRYWREEPLSLNPFGNFLGVNNLFPNFDISGALDKTGVALFSRADGQFMSKVGQGMNFLKNLGKSQTASAGEGAGGGPVSDTSQTGGTLDNVPVNS
jgi:hypothetical protein